MFQSTPPAWGGDWIFQTYWKPGWFQSTPPAWGGDHCADEILQGSPGFNPRHPRGVATSGAVCPSSGTVSIHATRVGWRQWGFKLLCPFNVSIHATRVGWRRKLDAFINWTFRFNPRHPRGVATFRPRRPPAPCRFNPRHPRGVATGEFLNSAFLLSFNPRHPRGVATRIDGNACMVLLFQSTPPAWGGDRPHER